MGKPIQEANIALEGHHPPTPLRDRSPPYVVIPGSWHRLIPSSHHSAPKYTNSTPALPHHTTRVQLACLLLPAVAESRVVVERRLQLLGLRHLTNSLRSDTWQCVSASRAPASQAPHRLCTAITKLLIRVKRNSPSSCAVLLRAHPATAVTLAPAPCHTDPFCLSACPHLHEVLVHGVVPLVPDGEHARLRADVAQVGAVEALWIKGVPARPQGLVRGSKKIRTALIGATIMP